MPASSSTTDLKDQYDFIIVGGGTAGLVVAARLSENASTQVLVIEAGPDRSDDPAILTPGFNFSLYDNPDYDWCLSSVRQKGLNGRKVPQQRGKLLGGSSAIFQLQMVYSSPASFDAWEALGNTGWNWKTMFPYLRKFHTHHPPGPGDAASELLKLANIDAAIESSEGPIQTMYSDTGDLDKAWFQAWRKIVDGLGYEGDEVGGGIQPASIDPRTMTRSYAVPAYYSADISSRANLRVVTDALVTRVLLEKKGDEVLASGVEFSSKSGETLTTKASREVILAAGTFKSPQILELSGVGDSQLLGQHSIEVLIDNPNVGENLQDHLTVMPSYEVKDGIPTGDMAKRDPHIMSALLEMYQKDGSGPLGHHFIPFAYFRLPETFGADGKSFISSFLKRVSPEATSPAEKLKDDVTAAILSNATVQHGLIKIQFNVRGKEKISEMVDDDSKGNYITILTSLNHPFSRGNVHITSASPQDDPRIDPRYLSNPMDLELLARHVQFVDIVTSTAPLSDFLKPDGRRIPDDAWVDGRLDLEGARRVVREQTISNYHPAGTCSMGPRESGGVVDGRLRVYGVKALRVVDASVFPLLPRGNIISSVYAVAERAADLIKEDWKGM